MRRPRFRRSPSSKFTMPEYTVSIPPSPTRLSLRNRDTGFAEPFCGSRNTSLPHPEANLAPDACITEEDVNPARALLRYRASFLAQQAEQRRTGPPVGSHFRNVSSSSTATTVSSTSSDEGAGGAIAALGRMAISSIRAGEMPRLDAFLGGHREEEEEDGGLESDGMSSRDPDSPPHLGQEFGGRVGGEQKEARGLRRRGSFMGRFIHR